MTLNVFPYVIWEMQDAVNDCEQYAGSTNNDDASVHAWDEAVAFCGLGDRRRGAAPPRPGRYAVRPHGRTATVR